MQPRPLPQRLARARIMAAQQHGLFARFILPPDVFYVEDASIPTAATDGRRFFYNPTFLASLPTDQHIAAVLVHEGIHVALGHCARLRPSYNPHIWNLAVDAIVNALLDKMNLGQYLPEWVFRDSRFDEKNSAEEVYRILYQERQSGQQPQPQQGQGQGQGQSFGDVQSPSYSSATEREDDILQQRSKFLAAARQETARQKKQGTIPGWLRELSDLAARARSDWREQLAHFCQNASRPDETWTRPKRKLMSATDIYLPGGKAPALERLVIAVDISASISHEEAAAFWANLSAIHSATQPEETTVLYVDTKVRKTQTFGPSDPLIPLQIGGGGTFFHPAFDWVAAHITPDPDAFIYLTDMAAEQTADPGYPVLWVSTNPRGPDQPHGRRIELDLGA